MTKLKELPKLDRPREKFLRNGSDGLSTPELLAILIGSGIKGRNAKQLSQLLVKKFGNNLPKVDVKELMTIPGIGQAKALQIAAALALGKRLLDVRNGEKTSIQDSHDAVLLASEIRDKKKEYLLCLYINARGELLKKEVISIGILDKNILHPREVFGPALELRAAGVILIHNHPSGNSEPSEQDYLILKNIIDAGSILGINVVDFIIVTEQDYHSVANTRGKKSGTADIYISDEGQTSLFGPLETEKPPNQVVGSKIAIGDYLSPATVASQIQLQSRRYIGNKYKLLDWIFSVIDKECRERDVFIDLFAGTGVVSAIASRHFRHVIVNDFLYSNYAVYKGFFAKGDWEKAKLEDMIREYNNVDGESISDNYFSEHFGGKYFSRFSARVIGMVRDNIEENRTRLTDKEYHILLSSLLYSVDKIANTVGHYDAFFRKDAIRDRFFMRLITPFERINFEIFREDANSLAKKVGGDVVYIDPPYNSRQYSRFYHVLETLTKWDKPRLFGTALKPTPENMSDYCRTSAKQRLRELVTDIKAKYLVVSYNNTYESKSNSSRNKITLSDIKDLLGTRGETKVYEKEYRHFNAGSTSFKNHKEYLFVTRVENGL